MADQNPVRVSIRNGTVTIRLPVKLLLGPRPVRPHRTARADWRVLDTVRGMWKNRKPGALAYQHRTRAEWN